MSLNNHLLAVIESGGEAREVDIQFRYGEVREYVYRVGDEVYITEKEREFVNKWTVVPGIAAIPSCAEADISSTKELFFRIVIFENVIASIIQTTEEDYDMLERLTT